MIRLGIPDDPPRSPATGRLADLARAGHLGLLQPSMLVEFEIHHVVDGPGRLVGILGAGTGGFAETLSAGGNGVGVVVGTRIAERPAEAGRSTVHLAAGATRAAFHGSARPNPTFQHGSAERFDAVVCIEDEPRRITLRHGLALRDALHEVTQISVAEHAPLLSLQSPAQIPPHTSRQVTGATPSRTVATSRSSSLALRFSLALARPRASARLRIADRLAEYCRCRGLGLWLADTRAGYHDGDWFIVTPHERSTARSQYDPGERKRVPGQTAEGCLPITLVGPARLGSTHAVAAFLARFPTAGVLACSMTPLDDLAFVHLQLAVNGASRGRLTGINRALASRARPGSGPAEVLPYVMSDLLRSTPDGDLDPRDMLAVAEDYQVVLGPALPVVVDTATVRLPIWFAWDMRAGQGGAGLGVLVRTLAEALTLVGLATCDAADAGLAPSTEYLVCRQVGPSRLKGKGKLAVPKRVIDEKFPATRFESAPARLCNVLEQAWRARLAADPGGADVTALSVSWRESWLGHWT